MAAVEEVVKPLVGEVEDLREDTLDDLVKDRADYLTGYQNDAYAARYRALVDKVRAVETAVTPGTDRLTRAIARYYFKLLSYKDEYEVARLYSNGEFTERLERQFQGDYELRFHLAPPLIARRDPETGHLKKREYGPWVMKIFPMLSALKGLRGTGLDVFGWTEERRRERALITEYETLTAHLLANLSEANHHMAVQCAEVPETIRGFGHVKLASIETAKAKEAELVAMFDAPPPASSDQPAAQAAD